MLGLWKDPCMRPYWARIWYTAQTTKYGIITVAHG
jgi:hypothetical protein